MRVAKKIVVHTLCVLFLFMSKEGMGVGNRLDVFRYDVVVYSGTSSGIMAAIAAAKNGQSVALLEPTDHIGGMMTSGLGFTDYGKPDLGKIIGGYARDFFNRIRDHYGSDVVRRFNGSLGIEITGNPRLGDNGWYFEPHVAELVFNKMLKDAGVVVHLKSRVREKNGVIKNGNHLLALEMENGNRFEGKIFIDAGYEGDVLAQAGVSYTIGRESAKAYGEPLAGVMPAHRKTAIDHGMEQGMGFKISAYDNKGALLPGIYNGPRGVPGEADRKVQAYNFRLCLTTNPKNQVPITKPAGYDPRQFEVLARLFQAMLAQGKHLTLGNVLKTSPLYNKKTDTNNQGAFSTDFVNESWHYAEASYAERKKIYQKHVDYTKGLLYFLATDKKVPVAVRTEMKQWGLAKDEFTDNHHWPYLLYVREGRRMVGEYVMAQHDVQHTITKEDVIGMGSYAADSHIIQRRVNEDSMVENEGQMFENIVQRPYQIPYRMLTPRNREANNLLVTICFSASHVAYQTLRMEPQFMITGHAAGTAAHLAIRSGNADVQKIDVNQLKGKLRSEQQVLAF